MLKYTLLLLVLLTACVQPPAARFNVQTVASEPSFYPHEAGLTWEYLEAGKQRDALRIKKDSLGVSSVGGKTYHVSRLYGRGFNTSYFETYGDNGVFLAREDRPGAVLVYNPPIQTLPPETNFTVGHSWSGTTQTSIYYTEGDTEPTLVTLNYRYSIIDKRQLLIEGKPFETFIISVRLEQTLDNQTDAVDQEIWFTPYRGELKTKDGLYLIN
jgi:hypothetical protein